jgi:hypothetical protein
VGIRFGAIERGIDHMVKVNFLGRIADRALPAISSEEAVATGRPFGAVDVFVIGVSELAGFLGGFTPYVHAVYGYSRPLEISSGYLSFTLGKTLDCLFFEAFESVAAVLNHICPVSHA